MTELDDEVRPATTGWAVREVNGWIVPPVVDGVADFSSPRRPVRFRIDDDVFEGPGELPLERQFDLVNLAAQVEDPATADRVGVVRAMLDVLLLPESAARFVGRLTDARNPIGVQRFAAIFRWLVAQHSDAAPTDLPPPTGG